MLKRLFSIITISLVLTGSFFSAYNIKYPVYADTSTDEWTQVTTNQQLVEAFKYYCKSRDVTIEGSVADGVTSFTTKTFNGIVNTLGIDVNTLQANLKYQTDGNLGTKFLFNTFSIDAYNRIFSQFLQDNELDVGDNVNNKSLFDGKYFDESDSLIWVVSDNTVGFVNYPSSNIIQRGSIVANGNTLKTMYDNGYRQYSFPLNLKTITLGMSEYDTGNAYYTSTYGAINQVYYFSYNSYWDYKENMTGTIFLYNTNTQTYNAGTYAIRQDSQGNLYEHLTAQGGEVVFPQNNQPVTVNIYLTTNNNVINNNNYEGDTIINNNGDTNNYYPDNPDNPDIPDPNPGPTPDPPTIPDSGGWQDFSLPDMPNDWLIYGMEKKFPFDIPFNILFALSLLNHEPEIPKFEGDIDLQVCTWHYDIDLTPFDDIATILRKFEVLGFIIGLAILTKNLINWG